jgi:PAS domain S-box-containing protein
MKLETPASLPFLEGGGEMGALMRAKDWASTPLGAVHSWPQSLRTAVSILLNSRYPMFIFWGPQLIKIYNDGYRPIPGDKHPWALGRPGMEVWPEIWSDIGPMVERVVQRGEATWSEDLRLFMKRRGFPEEVFFTFSYSPIRDESGGVGGMFCACTETTLKVQGERRLKLLRDLAAAGAEARTVGDACTAAMQVLAGSPADVPFALVYLLEEGGARLAASAGVAAGDAPGDWPLGEKALLSELATRFARVPAGPWPEPPSCAMVLPIAGGALVLGVSSRIAFDDAYCSFFELVAGQLEASLASARESEAERRRAEQLAEIDRAKTAFFSNVSHEFRTPLTLMLGPLGDLLLQRGQQMPAASREALEVVQRNGQRLLKLVNTLLDFARIEAGRAQASYEPVDLAALTAELAANFRSACERAGLALKVDCPPAGEPGYVDREMWEKIVLNLVSNAFKFTLAGGIFVSLRREKDFVLEVRDTGSGIPAEELPRMFERFHRVEGARGRSHEGSGIGLALVHELVKLHGGSIAVESASGRGTTFTVRILRGAAHLPADQVRAPADGASPSTRAEAYVEEALSWLPGGEVPAPRHIGKRVLLADDNADLRAYARRLLAEHYAVEAVADGEAALAAARERRPDLVVTDVMMPRLDGFTLISELRADEALRDIPVIALSARAGEEARLEGLGRGADEYLVKPFSARELLVRVETLLRSAGLRREHEQALRDYLEGLLEGFVAYNENWVMTYMNAAGERLLGRRREEVLGKTWHQAFPHAVGNPVDQMYQRVMRTRQAESIEYDYAHYGRSFEISASPVRSGGIAVYFRDVSDRAGLYRSLQESEQRFRTVVETQSEMVCRFRLDGTLLFVNSAYARASGATPEAMVGRNFWDLIPEGERDNVRRMLERLTPQAPEVRIENRFETAAATRWTLWTNRALAFDAGGRVLEAQSTGIDITERKRAEEALRQADRQKDEFIATLAHELRNPLAPIRNGLHLLRLSGNADAAAAPIHEMMERQVGHLVRLTDDLLEMSRITRGVLELRRERVQLAAVARSAVETTEPQIRAGGHRLAIELPPEPLWVEGDPVRLAQILANLLNNAARYTDKGGAIWLTARREAHAAVVSVRDSGAGIAPGDLERVFEMFSRGERSSGLGIGLALARRLAGMHGGTLQAASEGPGKGTEFTLRLPLAPEDGKTSAPPLSETTLLPPKRILVVDDNRDAADSLGMLLKFLGADVQVAHGGREALEAFEAYRPSIVLLDLGMPEMDGYQVACAIRSRADGARVPIVALTGWGQEEDRRRSREAGFDHHLIKPADIGALRALLVSL